MSQDRDQVTNAVLAFVNIQSWDKSKRIVEEHLDVLLTVAADEILAALHTKYQDDEDATAILEEGRALKESSPTCGANR